MTELLLTEITDYKTKEVFCELTDQINSELLDCWNVKNINDKADMLKDLEDIGAYVNGVSLYFFDASKSPENIRT